MDIVKVKRGKVAIRHILEIIGEEKAFILGGFARFACSPRARNIAKAGDIDIYCYDENAFSVLRDKLDASGLERYAKENPVCVSYKKHKSIAKGYNIQLIKPIEDFNLKTKGELKEIISNFDFTVARIGILDLERGLADEDFLEDEKKMIIKLKFIHCPISSTIRLMKYAKKGYRVRPREVFKLFIDWDNRDDKYKTKLINLFTRSDNDELTDVEIEELEILLHRD